MWVFGRISKKRPADKPPETTSIATTELAANEKPGTSVSSRKPPDEPKVIRIQIPLPSFEYRRVPPHSSSGSTRHALVRQDWHGRDGRQYGHSFRICGKTVVELIDGCIVNDRRLWTGVRGSGLPLEALRSLAMQASITRLTQRKTLPFAPPVRVWIHSRRKKQCPKRILRRGMPADGRRANRHRKLPFCPWADYPDVYIRSPWPDPKE